MNIPTPNDLARRFFAALEARKNAIVAWFNPRLDTLSTAVVNTEPLPQWTNLPLIGFAGAVWTYAIALNWWGDSKAFVVSGLVILGVWFAAVFGRVVAEDVSK